MRYKDYEVYEDGKVISIKSGKELSTFRGKNNAYRMIDLSKNGLRERWLVHRLVATLYIPNLDNKPQVNHIDGNVINNNVENLEWVTHKENLHHHYTNGGTPIRNFTNCSLYKDEILIKECKSINEASRLGKELGGKYASLNKYHIDKKGFSIRTCND